MVYLIVGTFLIYLSFIEIFYRKSQNSQFTLLVAFFVLFLLSSFRFEVGTDWFSYAGFYFDNNSKSALALESGYMFFNNLFGELTKNYNIFLSFISLVSLAFMYKFLMQNSKYRLIAIFIYFSELFLYFNFSGMRQGVAIAITCYSTVYIINKNFKVFLALVFLASLFHTSALIFILAYFIVHQEYRKKTIGYIILFVMSFILFRELIVDFSLQYITSKHLIYYLTMATQADDLMKNYWVGMAKRLIIIIFYFSISVRERTKYSLNKYMKIYLFGFLIYIMTYTLSADIGTRLSSYFLIMDILIVSKFFQLNIGVYKKLVIFFTIIVMYCYKLYGYSLMETYVYQTI